MIHTHSRMRTQEEKVFPKKQNTPSIAADHTGYSTGYAHAGFGEDPGQDHTQEFKRCVCVRVYV